jgi:processive 1,2-diacylglycerol beta-glucosyltransferase
MLATREKIKSKNSAPKPLPQKGDLPVLLLTINNGAGHTRAAEAIAAALKRQNRRFAPRLAEVSSFMSPLARFTHVTAYLWLVKYLPFVWEKIDCYQKSQNRTSPEWFYRRECRRLFDLAREIKPAALIASEVGCCEIAALIKRDLGLKNAPLVAVNVNYDADRAWVQPEVDLFCLASETVREDFERNGARYRQIAAFGVPMQQGFGATNEIERRKLRRELNLKIDSQVILIAGGGEGIGRLAEITKKLLVATKAQIVVFAGRNEKLRERIEKLKKQNTERLRVLGWTNEIPQYFRAADLLVSKLGNTFDEALACGLPIISLTPPPGAERAQFELLEKYKIGRATHSLEELTRATVELLADEPEREAMRQRAAQFGKTDAAEKIAEWLENKIFENNLWEQKR